MVTIQLIITNSNGTSSSGNGIITDPDVIAAAHLVAKAITNTAVESASVTDA